MFDCRATEVYVWDNHGGGKNIDFSKIDTRAIKVDTKVTRYRYDFAKDLGASGIVFLGYHAMEGTPNGVLAHTFSSTSIQYAKLNGKAIGELYTDTRICASLGIKPIFHAGDDISIAELMPCPFFFANQAQQGFFRHQGWLQKMCLQ